MAEIFEDIFRTQAYSEPDAKDKAAFIQSSLNTVTYPGIELPETEYEPFEFAPDDAKAVQTTTYSSEKAASKRTAVHQLGPGDSPELNSIRYQVVSIISGEGKTSEAIIYKVKNDANKIFALKLYYEFTDEHHEPNPDTLQRIREISSKKKDILHLFDFGTGPNKYQGRFCFEISDFAEGGDLLRVPDIHEKYSPGFIHDVVITGINNGILALHKDKIFHCDLKPQNVYFLDANQTTIVIGDYGSAKSFEKTSEKELSHTTITKGTEFYLAPEQAFGIVSGKNDYYSLGMIVLHLLYPEKVTKSNLRKIFERRTKGIPIIDFDPKYERLNQLIEGLTLQDYNNRWGEEEVKNWLDGLDVNVNYGAMGARSYIKVGDYTLKTAPELASYIELGDTFYDELIEDKEAYSELLSWISQLQGDDNRLLFERMISYYKKYFGIEYVREAILFFYTPAREIKIGLKVYNFSNLLQLNENTSSFFSQIDSLWKITDIEKLRFWFFQFEFAIKQLRVKSSQDVIDVIDQTFVKISTIIGSDYVTDFSNLRATLYLDLRIEHFIDFFYAFNVSRGFRDINHNRLTTLDDVSNYFENHPQMYQQKLMNLEKLGFLHQVSAEEFCEYITKNEQSFNFILKRSEDFPVLITLVSGFVKDRFSVEFVREYLHNYSDDDEYIFKEAINRIIQPDQPVRVGYDEINFYKKGDFNNKVKNFFELLDIEWKKSDFREIILNLFSFELSLLLIAREDKIAYKSMIKPVLDKIGNTLRTSAGNMNTLQCNFYKLAANENVIDLFYHFIQNRPFRHKLQELNTVEEIGFFYLQNSQMFSDSFSQFEREAFLKYHALKSFANLNYEEFILKVFRAKAKIETEITNIHFDEPNAGEVTVKYKHIISLNDFLQSEGYSVKFVSPSTEPQQVTIKGGEFANTDALFERFTSAVLGKNHIQDTKLIGKSKESFTNFFKKKNKLEYRQSFSYIPNYILYLFPVFGFLFLFSEYLVDQSIFKSLLYAISPSLNMVLVRVAKFYFWVLLFTAYILNFIISILLLVPIYSLFKTKDMFNKFFIYYGSLINKAILSFIFAPVIFIAIFFLIDYVSTGIIGSSNVIIMGYSLDKIGIFLYILYILQLLLKIVVAFFMSFRKFRFLPLAISILIYIIVAFLFIGYSTSHTVENKDVPDDFSSNTLKTPEQSQPVFNYPA